MNIKSLLNKKGWTGEEVGKALIASILNDIKNQGKAYQPLFTQADFDKMENSLSTEQDYLTYGIYRDIYNSLIESFNKGQALYQQFYNGYSRLLVEFREIQHTESAQRAITEYPLIVTAEQYKRLETEAKAKLSAYKESYNSLVFNILEALLNTDYTDMPEAIKNTLEATEKEPAKNKCYIDLYNPTFGEGYYELPDGRRSDRMTNEEWEKALGELYLKNHKTKTGEEPISPEEALKERNLNAIINGYELFFKGAEAIRKAYKTATGKDIDGTDSELLEALGSIIDLTEKKYYKPKAQELERAFGYDTPVEWHTYETPPQDLTQYDLLNIYIEEYRKGTKKPLKDLKSDYPDLYISLTAYIEEHIPQAKGLKDSELYEDIISWSELEKLNIISYENITTPTDNDIIELFTEEDTTENYSKRIRILYKSIAIVQNPHSSYIDENGDYIERSNPLADFKSLNSVAGNPDKIAEIEALQHKLINPALSYLYAFNAFMGILEGVYNISELEKVARFDVSVFERKTQGYNNLLYVLYYAIYGVGEERNKKREQIKAIFTPLETDKLKPTQESIDAVRAELIELGYTTLARKKLKYFDNFITPLMEKGAT